MRKHRGKGFSLFGNLKLRDKSIERSLLQQAMLVSCITRAMLVRESPNPPNQFLSKTGSASFGCLNTNAITDIRAFTKCTLCVLTREEYIRCFSGLSNFVRLIRTHWCSTYARLFQFMHAYCLNVHMPKDFSLFYPSNQFGIDCLFAENQNMMCPTVWIRFCCRLNVRRLFFSASSKVITICAEGQSFTLRTGRNEVNAKLRLLENQIWGFCTFTLISLISLRILSANTSYSDSACDFHSEKKMMSLLIKLIPPSRILNSMFSDSCP